MSDLSPYFAQEDPERVAALSFSDMALGMVSSPILDIAYAVRARIDAGERVAPFTVGDFKCKEFQAPTPLKTFIKEAIDAGATDYPPADGVPELRKAIIANLKHDLDLDYPIESVVVGSGARPLLFGAYQVLINAGEKVLTPAPSWNNKNFCQLVSAEHVVVPSRPADAFMPTAEGLRPHIKGARMLLLCSPMNPAGTMIRTQQMTDICDLIIKENTRREAAGERLLYLVYDQVYRMLTFDGREHVTPVSVRPEMARYTLMIDAISKGFASTGLRVGWVVCPPFIAKRLKALMTHMGAWAPRPEQLATARLLDAPDLVAEYLVGFKAQIQSRLNLLYETFTAWAAEGLPVEAIAPEGAIYLSVRFGLEGRPGFPDDTAVREFLLTEAGCAIVPFSAFDDVYNRGWVRFSVGSVTLDDIHFSLGLLKPALEKILSA